MQKQKIFTQTLILISIVAILIVTISLTLCNNSKNNPEKIFYANLKSHMKNKQFKIPLKSLTNFKWEKITFINAYSGMEDIERNTCSAGNEDGQWALAFTEKEKLTACINGKTLLPNKTLSSNSSFNSNSIIVISGKIFSIKE